MPNVCEECDALNTDGATVCRACGYPLFLASATPAAPFRRTAVMVPAGSGRPFTWLAGGLAAMVLLALAALIFDLASSPPQRTQFGPNAPPFPPVLPAPLVAPSAPPGLTGDTAVAGSAAAAASTVAAPALRSSSPAPLKRPAAKSSVKPPVSGNMNPAAAEADTAASDHPPPGRAGPLPARSEAETSPHEICADKSFLALGICLAEQCNTRALFDHPDCVQVREQDNKRREREELGG
jgi:hypothetical protein